MEIPIGPLSNFGLVGMALKQNSFGNYNLEMEFVNRPSQ